MIKAHLIKAINLAVFFMLMVFSTASLAAKPVSIKYIEDIIINDSLIYSYYRVKCSDGRKADISAWNRQTKWCVGKGRQDDCGKTQITAAKKVCQ